MQSKSWVEYFTRHAGNETFRTILHELAGKRPIPEGSVSDGSPFEAAVWRHTKRPLSLWIEDWRVALKESASPWYVHLFKDLWTGIFLVVGIVGGISYFFIRRRRKQQIDQMPDG